MKVLFQFVVFSLFFILVNCSNNLIKDDENTQVIDPSVIYTDALNELAKKNYEEAIKKFTDIELKYPLSNEALQAQIMLAFIEYSRLEYDLAIIKLEKIINRYPSYKDIDYVYYLKAMCYYERVENPELDGQNNILALKNFREIINYFPNSKYAKDSKQKIILLNENLAAKHMSVAMFYLKQKKYMASLKRFQKVVDEYSESKYTPEALHRMVEIYYTLGILEEAKKTASVLAYNYPQSKWYKYSYDIVGDQNLLKPKNKGFIKKILKKISTNDEE
tara:strand:+ start:1049 stop:1876 length:828 start_codon:yes stop_codon:yes gene_type:complete